MTNPTPPAATSGFTIAQALREVLQPWSAGTYALIMTRAAEIQAARTLEAQHSGMVGDWLTEAARLAKAADNWPEKRPQGISELLELRNFILSLTAPPIAQQGGGEVTDCGHSKFDPCHNCEPTEAALASKAGDVYRSGWLASCDPIDPTPAASGVDALLEMLADLLDGAANSTGWITLSDGTVIGARETFIQLRQALAAQPSPVVTGLWLCQEHKAKSEAQPATGVGGCSLYRSASYDKQDGGYPVHRGNEAPIARFIVQGDAVDYAAYRNRMIDKNGSDALPSTRPAESVAQGGEAVYQWRDAYGGWRDCTADHWESYTTNDKRILYTTPTPATGSGGEAA